MSIKNLLILVILVLGFTGCGPKWSSKSLPTNYKSDKIIEITGNNVTELSFQNVNKKPIDFDKYNIKTTILNKEYQESLKLREIRYQKFEEDYKYGKFYDRDRNDYYIFTSDLNGQEYKYNKYRDTLVFRTYCSTKDKDGSCSTNYNRNSFDLYIGGKDKYRKYKKSFKEVFSNKIYNEFGGIGVRWKKDDNNKFICMRIRKGHGADNAGMMKNDIFYSIDNNIINEQTSKKEFSELLRGEVDSKVKIVVIRNNKKIPLLITRKHIRYLDWKKTLHKNVFDFSKKHSLFSIENKLISENTISNKDMIEIKNLPYWIDYKIDFNDDIINIKLISKSNNKSFFNKHPVNFSIQKDYQYLIPKFLTKDSFDIQVALRGSHKYENIKVNYYHLPGIDEEINRLESLGHGYIKFTSNQDKVDIFIDNLKKGTITKNKPFVAKLVEGSHTVLAKKYLFGSKSININVEADDAFAYHFDLKPSGNMYEAVGSGKIVQSIGELVVLSSRNDLEVDIDGAVRIPPFKLPNMATGKYKIKIKGPGVKKSIEIEVIPNKKNIINLDDLL